jgi:hypothetical protein
VTWQVAVEPARPHQAKAGAGPGPDPHRPGDPCTKGVQLLGWPFFGNCHLFGGGPKRGAAFWGAGPVHLATSFL